MHSQIISFTLNGKVVDAQDGSPIELASVYISETAIFTETDALGNFQLFLPQKENYLIKVNRLGFKPIEKKIKWKEVQSGKLIEILLTRIVNTEVEITAENEDMESGG
ncbi:MAG: carboxypeptidase-like regulatory domain-containing protein [Saprospiraceae bacterium]|nr:carboxypeptidase-like regulatory domain-containing protein [Saprospiraceae bacterium]